MKNILYVGKAKHESLTVSRNLFVGIGINENVFEPKICLEKNKNKGKFKAKT